jgi:MoaA/NifB/PqqE/SkfB family radical SAM enzyme
MDIRDYASKFKHVVSLARSRGLKYTYNYIFFYMFWVTRRTSIVKLLQWLEPYPSYIEIEVTTRCNLKCIICEHTYWDEPNRDMTFDEFKSIVDQFPRLKWIGLTGIGESFINKDFMEMLRYVKSKNVFVELYDTFFFIDRGVAEGLIDMRLDMLFASIDAATKETYEKIRVGSNFDRVIDNVRTLIELKKLKGSAYPQIAFHYIVNKENLRDLPQYMDLVHSIVQGEEVTIQVTRMLHEFEAIKGLFVEVPSDIVNEVERKAEEFGISVRWNEDVPQIKPPISKCIEWTMPFIFVTGHVIPCCSGNEAGHRDFQKRTALGNVFEQSFKEIWSGERYKLLRRMIRKGEVPLPCRNCCLYETGSVEQCGS